jgi:hypothetical protein
MAGGLSTQPMLVTLVVLNITMIVAAAYYLARQEEHRVAGIAQVTELLRMCIRGAPALGRQSVDQGAPGAPVEGGG